MKPTIKNTANKFVASILLLASASMALASDKLEIMESPEFDEFYLASSFSIPTSKKIFIEEADVSFTEAWLFENQTEATDTYIRIIKTKYGTALVSDIEAELKKQGWTIMEEKTNDSIVLKPHLFDLNIIAPTATPGKQVILLVNVGSAAVDLSYFSPKGVPIMQIIDAEETPLIVGSPLANRSFNFTYFRMLFENWGHLSTAYLDSVVEEVEKHKK